MSTSISYSELTTFSNCRKQWEYLYHKGLQAKRPEPLPEIGSLCHKGVEYYWHNIKQGIEDNEKVENDEFIWAEALMSYALDEQERLKTLFPPHSEQLQSAVGQLKQSSAIALEVVGRYIERYKEEDANTDPILVEHPFEIQIPDTDVTVKGKIDLLCQDRTTGKYILRDSKFTRGAFKSDEQILLNFQLGVYQWVCHQMGFEVDLLEYDQVKAIPFREPELTKDMKALKRIGFFCDWETYQLVIDRYNFNRYDYLDVMAKLKEKEFFRRTTIQRTEIESHNFGIDLRNRCEELWNIKEFMDCDNVNPIYRTAEVGKCARCPVKEICIEELKGGDVEYLMENYHVKPRYQSVEIDIEEDLG